MNFHKLKALFNNKVLLYAISRYATFLIQFINSLLIAFYLGPYYLGIWGFITLIVQYLNQINLGISHSVNAIISIHKKKEWYVQRVIGTSLTMLLGLSFLIVIFFTANYIFDFGIGDKFNFIKYSLVITAVGILGYFNSMFSNVFRVHGRIKEIIVNQSSLPILTLVSILLFKETSHLITALVGAYFLAFLIPFSIYIYNFPYTLKFYFIFRLVKKIQKKGWYLFIYNTSFYLIIISTKTFISTNYTIEEFGYFTFAYTFANVTLLLLQSFSFLIFPKIVNKFSIYTIEKSKLILKEVMNLYMVSSHFLIHSFIFIFPLFIFLFPKYESSSNAFKLIALTIILYTNSFGFISLLIAKEKEKLLGYIAFIALIINLIMLYVLTSFLKVDFGYAILATMTSNLFFVFGIGYLGNLNLGIPFKISYILEDVFPVKLLIPYLFSLILAIIDANYILFSIPLLVLLFLNYKVFIKIKNFIKKILLNPNIINI